MRYYKFGAVAINVDKIKAIEATEDCFIIITTKDANLRFCKKDCPREYDAIQNLIEKIGKLG